MKRDYIITFITEFFVLLSALIAYRLASSFLGKDGFSEYVLTRRIISFTQSILLLGFSIGIPRYIAYNRKKTGIAQPDTYFVSGLGGSLILLVVFLSLINIFQREFSFLCFGSASYAYLCIPISFMASGLMISVFCYSYFRGKIMMGKANLLQAINLGVVPLVVFLFFSKTTYQVLLWTGIFWVIVSFICLIGILSGIKINDKDVIPYFKELFIYGVQRVPGDFGLAALFGLPAIIVAHMAGVKEAGYMAFGISVINMAGSAFTPLGLVLLPQTSQMIADNKINLLKGYVIKILFVSLGLTVLGLVVFELFAPQLIRIYLGDSFSDLVRIARIALVSCLGYTVYVTMRSILDAYYVKAVNTKNIFISLLVFLFFTGLILLFKRSYLYLVFSFMMSVLTLGALTLYEIRKIFGTKENYFNNQDSA